MTLRVIPSPAHVEPREGVLSCAGALQVEHAACGEDADAAVALLQSTPSAGPRVICEAVDSSAMRGAGGYVLDVTDRKVMLRASDRAGFLHGAQTLLQLLPPDGSSGTPFTIPAVHIADAPRFSWRGLHVDVARHWFPIEDLKRLVDTMALHKLNRLHWHLVDDQGWRIEIHSFPRLTQVGAHRAESPQVGARTEGDGTPYGGFYTQAEVRDLVAHAAALGITVVPEIEMPGHAQAAIAAYPELGHGTPPTVWTRWGVSERIFNVRDETFAFLDQVLEEVAGLFPGPWIHLGGDEVPTTEWETSPDAQARMAAERLTSPRDLQGWFLSRAAKGVTQRGRHAICWDEVLECGASSDVVVMAWRAAKHARTAAARGHDVVLCPQPFCYFDHYQGAPESEPEAIGGHTDVHKVLSFDPTAGDWTDAERAHLLGVQGNLWSEYIHDAKHLEYMAWPRASALAEVAWSPERARDPDEFLARWSHMAKRLDAMGVTYCEPRDEGPNP